MSGDAARTIRFSLNGQPIARSVATNLMAADLLRGEENLTGLKIGCDQAVCGACTILVDGAPTTSCATFAFMLDGAEVRTIEGLAGADALHPVQQAFKNNSAFQCGYCTPGMILLAAALLERRPNPSEADITAWMSANVCRCTGYKMIVEAVEAAAQAMGDAS